ncbi:MAG: lysophospholipid acyltransferase family protein [Acholeplasmataceae bacterium]|nr:lysophospholipid acyltransferase family protein [Acholeplasmataceae bacterium]
MKTQKEVRKRHYIITRMVRPFIWLYFKMVYRLKINVPRVYKKDGPFVVLANHTVNPDPIIMSMSFPFHLYYIASEQIFNLGFISRFLNYAVNPIRKSKSVSDINTIRKLKRIVKEEGSIGIFPEGNTTYDGITATIHPSTAKLIKMLKLPVLILNTKGLYLTYPRWAVFRKKGRSEIYLKKRLEVTDYENLTDDELYKVLIDNLHVDAIQDQETSNILFKGKNIAVGLQRMIFIDLEKKIPFVTYTTGNKLKSTMSDFELIYQTNGKLLTKDNKEITLNELNNQVKIAYYEYYRTSPIQHLFVENVEMIESLPTKKISHGEVELNLRKDSLYFTGENGVITWHFDDITNIAIQGKRQIIIYMSNKTYLIRLDLSSSPYKYLLTYQIYNYMKSGGTNIDEHLSKLGL